MWHCNGVPPHELPHQCQSQGRIAIVQVLPADANKRKLGCFAQLHCIVAILQLRRGTIQASTQDGKNLETKLKGL